MSDGKKFGVKDIANAQERLTEVERKFSIIQERIQAYDAVLSEFQALKVELKSNRKTLESFVAATSSVFDELRLKIDTYSAQFQILHAKAESNAKTIDDHKNYVSKFVATHNKIYQDFNEVISKIKEQLGSSLEESKIIKGRLNDQVLMMNTIPKDIGSLSSKIDKLTDAHIKFKDATAASQATLSDQQTKLAKTISSLPSLQEWANTLYGRVQQDAIYREKQATAYVDKKIEGLAKDFDSNPLSAESVKASLFKEIETLALDGKNAYLKSNNCSAQIALLEKKLENLNLLIKKYELTK